ncbi:MAG TPA: glycosyltransferase family 2 protein [Bacteroidales bacterium]|nr:glycosyltransferase family 2 protein [Bacteroidales bacterium]
MIDKSRLTIVIPAFNEAENLEIVLPEIIGFCNKNNYKLIVVNDGSFDETRNLLEKNKKNEIFKVIHHKLNKGYGAAIKTGILECDTEYVITIDADGQHSISDVEKLYCKILEKDADMVVGSRKGLRSASFMRKVGKGLIRIIAKILMSVPIHDINSGMKICRTELAKKYLILTPDTMSYSDIITLIFINNRHLVIEEPITINDRLKGKSTIRLETAFQTVMEIINIVIMFNPAKIFFPISLLCIVVGLSIGIPILAMGKGVSVGSLLGIFSGILFFLLGLIAEQLSWIRRNSRK